MAEKKIQIRDLRNSDWYWIQREIYENYVSEIGIIGLALYNAYASYSRNEGKCFPSQKTISEKLKLSIPTIIKYNKILEENNLIKIESGKEKGIVNIVSLLKLKGIKQVKTPSKPGLDQGIKQVKTESKAIESKTNKDIVFASQSDASPQGKEINELIDKFKAVNPSYERLFANKTQRAAMERLLKKMGRQKLEQILDILPAIFGKAYAPRIFTPFQLEQKLPDLFAYLKERSEIGQRVFTIRPKNENQN